MRTVGAIFDSRLQAERAAQRLCVLGISQEQLTLLSPGGRERVREAVPTDEGEAQGTGAAIGAVVGGATGAAAGMPLGAAVGLMVPGIGPVIAFGLIGAALFGAGGAAIGSALENTLTPGVPRDDVFLYEGALRQGKSVVIALTEDDVLAERAREAVRAEGGVEIDAARDAWWTGLPEADRGAYTAAEERAYRAGFEAALVHDTDLAARTGLSDRYGPLVDDPAFRRGWERGRAHRAGARAWRKSA
jgi:hypothetical protein